MKWKPGDVVKTIIAKHGANLFDESWVVAIGIILESKRQYVFDIEKKETYYKILIQNHIPIDRRHSTVYPLDTPDDHIIEKENALPF